MNTMRHLTIDELKSVSGGGMAGAGGGVGGVGAGMGKILGGGGTNCTTVPSAVTVHGAVFYDYSRPLRVCLLDWIAPRGRRNERKTRRGASLLGMGNARQGANKRSEEDDRYDA